MLGFCARIPLETWKFQCVYFVCVVLCVGRDLATGCSPIYGVLPTLYRIKELKMRPRPNIWAVQQLMMMIMVIIIIIIIIMIPNSQKMRDLADMLHVSESP
jgi:hypothetical protein